MTTTLDPVTSMKVFTSVNVTCFSGHCGVGTSGYTSSGLPATPQSGYADGDSDVSRFNSPRGLDVTDLGDIIVADTGNHLIRVIQRNGTAHTLAGNLRIAEEDPSNPGEPLPGCLPPCLEGVEGNHDGDLTMARFSFPADVAVLSNATERGSHAIHVVDGHLLRRISLEVDSFEGSLNLKPYDVVSNLYSIRSTARVSTLAGGGEAGERDGDGRESRFNGPEALAVTSDGITYIADKVACRIRRITPASLTAVTAGECGTTVDELFRSDGCSSYDPPVDELDLKVTPAMGFMYNNHVYRDSFDVEGGSDYVGRMIKDCVGVPPRDMLDKRFWDSIKTTYPYNKNLVIDDYRNDTREDPNEGSTIKVYCRQGCGGGGTLGTLEVWGGPY